MKEKKEGQGWNPEQGREVGRKRQQSKLEEQALEAEAKPDKAPSETRRGQDPEEERDMDLVECCWEVGQLRTEDPSLNQLRC